MKTIEKVRQVVDKNYQCDGCSKIFNYQSDAETCEALHTCAHLLPKYTVENVSANALNGEIAIYLRCLKCKKRLSDTHYYDVYDSDVAKLIFEKVEPQQITKLNPHL